MYWTGVKEEKRKMQKIAEKKESRECYIAKLCKWQKTYNQKYKGHSYEL